jgi:hypothetical protein
MESQIQDTETTTTEETTSSFDSELPGSMMSPSKPASSDSAWQEWVDVIVDFLSKVPEQVGTFFSDYKQPLTTVGLILAAAVTVYVTLSVLDAIDNIPLLSSILELVGLGYSIWFVMRYLLKASTRQELFSEFNALKDQVLGNKS